MSKRERGIGEVFHTARGFELIEFVDMNNEACSLQQSSAAIYTQPGTGAIWLGCKKNHPPHLGHEMSPRMHLHRKQVKQLVASLTRWLEKGSFK